MFMGSVVQQLGALVEGEAAPEANQSITKAVPEHTSLVTRHIVQYF